MSEAKIIKVSDVLHEVLDKMSGESMGIPTGFPKLDVKTKGLKPGELTIIAGRPSMGKSSLMTDMILSASKTKNVFVFSIEMCARLLIERMLANLGNVSYSKMKDAMLYSIELKRLDVAAKELFRRNIYINDSPWITVGNIKENIKTITSVKEQVIDCVFVDYLQLMGMSNSPNNRNQDLASISANLKGLARHFNIPFVVLSQLNRNVEYRESRRPQLCDLRDSGAIEQDADAVFLLHRPGYYATMNSQNATDDGAAEIIIAKQRNGPTCVVHTMWDGAKMSFGNRNIGVNTDIGLEDDI